MKKKIVLILMFAVCSMCLPKMVFAKNIKSSYNTNIDYQFFVDEDTTSNLKFKLYDKTGSLSYESEYDINSKKYRFFVDENNYKMWYYGDNPYYNTLGYSDDYESGIRDYIPYSSELKKLNTFNEVKDFLENSKVNNKWKNYGTYFYDPPSGYGIDYYSGLGYIYEFNIYTYIPMVLEGLDSNNNVILKKIVFASVNIRCDFRNADYDYYSDNYIDYYYVAISLINNTSHWNQKNQYVFGSSFLENVDFMRKTVLDYSDELWEKLNNGPIASNEIYSNNKINSNYVNKSLSSGMYNVSEQTLEDYASSLPVINLKKEDSNNDKKENDSKNIINVLTNPKTWTNGIVILTISMLVIIGSSFVLINRKNN